jgi:hypothetical protein
MINRQIRRLVRIIGEVVISDDRYFQGLAHHCGE